MTNLRKLWRRGALILLALPACMAFAAPVVLAPGASTNGGIGNEEQQAMQVTRDLYNLRLTFAEARSGAYLTGVSVTIEGTGRAASFGPYRDTGPLFYVHLDPGAYRVSATYAGSTQTRTVRIERGAVEAVFYWSQE